MSAFEFDHIREICDAPDGVNRLRQLVLALAVEGRLLPSSMDSLKRWRHLTLPDVADYRIGKTPPSKESRHWDVGGIPWVSISDMEHFGTLTMTAKGLSHACVTETFKYPPVPAGSLLMSFKLTVGKVCILGVAGYHNEAIISIQPKAGVSRDYLMRVLPAIAKQGKSKDALMGATLNSSTLAQLVVPLPFLPEQHRIVAKVDELMALCDRLEARQQDAEAAHARLVQALLDSLTQARDAEEFQAAWERVAGEFGDLFTTDASVEALKTAVVMLAVEGRLVRQISADEDGAALLKRLATAKQAATKDARKQKEITTSELPAPPFDAPSGWAWTHLDQVLAISGGVTLGRKLAGRPMSTAPYLRVANVQRGRLDLAEVKEIEVPTDEVEKYRLEAGDLLITEGGDWDKVGRTATWANELPLCLHQNHVFRARRCSDELDLHWVELYLNSPVARDYFAGASKQTTNLASINMTQLRSCAFPVPPLAEQRRIVAKVTELLDLCDQLKARIGAARAKQAQLAEALVKRAVEG